MTTDNKATTKATTKERLEQEVQRRDAMRAKLEAEHGTSDLTEKARHLIWAKAWEDGHAEGEDHVAYHYADLAEIALAAAAPVAPPKPEIDTGGREGQDLIDYINGRSDAFAKAYGVSAGDTISLHYLAGFREGSR